MATQKHYFLPKLPPWQFLIKWAPRQLATPPARLNYLTTTKLATFGNSSKSLKNALPLTPDFFARGRVPEMSAPDAQISRGFPDMTPKHFGDASFTLRRVVNHLNRILCLIRLFCTVYTYTFSKLARSEGTKD